MICRMRSVYVGVGIMRELRQSQYNLTEKSRGRRQRDRGSSVTERSLGTNRRFYILGIGYSDGQHCDI